MRKNCFQQKRSPLRSAKSDFRKSNELKKKNLNIQKIDDKEWEEILEEIDLQFLPIEYVKTIIITFEDKTIWEIDLQHSRKTQTEEKIEETLDELFQEYEGDISDLDFQLDMGKIKKYLTKRVSYFLKHNK